MDGAKRSGVVRKETLAHGVQNRYKYLFYFLPTTYWWGMVKCCVVWVGTTLFFGNFRFSVDIFRLHFVFKDPLGLKYMFLKLSIEVSSNSDLTALFKLLYKSISNSQ